jgi:cyclophilin family peptidyl-prolyl cis-trans isomerase
MPSSRKGKGGIQVGRAQKLKQQRKEEQAQQEKEARKDVYHKVIIVVVSILVIGVTVGLVFLVNSLKKKEAEKAVTAKQLVLDTTKGEIVIDLFTKDTPLTVEHISTLVDQGFYDNLRWYRIEDFVVQTGSHTQSLIAESEGGEPDQTLIQEAYQKDQEVGTVLDELGQSNVRGAVGLAKPNDEQTQLPKANSATTDFYILKQDATGLDPYFTVFGKVVKGMDVVDSLETTDILISAKVKNK